jgi:hypothetical protein
MNKMKRETGIGDSLLGRQGGSLSPPAPYKTAPQGDSSWPHTV